MGPSRGISPFGHMFNSAWTLRTQSSSPPVPREREDGQASSPPCTFLAPHHPRLDHRVFYPFEMTSASEDQRPEARVVFGWPRGSVWGWVSPPPTHTTGLWPSGFGAKQPASAIGLQRHLLFCGGFRDVYVQHCSTFSWGLSPLTH